jgi:hypothetical protein
VHRGGRGQSFVYELLYNAGRKLSVIYAARCFILSVAATVSLSCVSPVTHDDGGMPVMTATAICDLISRPESFDGQIVTVSATIKPAAHYMMTISDAKCGDQTITLGIPSKLDGVADAEKLRSAVLAGYPQPSNRRTRASLTGEFHLRPDDVPSMVLSLRSVADIETVRP